MMLEPAGEQELPEQIQGLRHQDLVDKLILFLERLSGGAGGRGILGNAGVRDAGEEFGGGSEPRAAAFVVTRGRLPEHVLPRRHIVAQVEPITGFAVLEGLDDLGSSEPGIDARNQQVGAKIARVAVVGSSLGFPRQTAGEVDAVDQQDRFVLPNVA